MTEERITIDSNLDIQLRIHVFGYYPQGECVLLIIFDTSKNHVIKSVVIDCFIEENREQLINVLQMYKVSNKNPLDLIVWTHPDDDHSRGMEILISKYANKQTILVTPDGMSLWTILRARTLRTYLKTLFYVGKNRLSVERVNNSNHRKYPEEYLPLYISDGVLDDLHFSIEILTPHADGIIKMTEINKSLKNNDISISSIIHFGAMNFYFGGDVENIALNRINQYRLTNLSYIKIPHHGSNTSDALPTIIENLYAEKENSEIIYITSVVTSYHNGKSQLPYDNVLNRYKSISNAIVKTDSIDRQHHYGMYYINYNIVAESIAESQCHGDANMWYERK